MSEEKMMRRMTMVVKEEIDWVGIMEEEEREEERRKTGAGGEETEDERKQRARRRRRVEEEERIGMMERRSREGGRFISKEAMRMGNMYDKAAVVGWGDDD